MPSTVDLSGSMRHVSPLLCPPDLKHVLPEVHTFQMHSSLPIYLLISIFACALISISTGAAVPTSFSATSIYNMLMYEQYTLYVCSMHIKYLNLYKCELGMQFP